MEDGEIIKARERKRPDSPYPEKDDSDDLRAHPEGLKLSISS